MSKKHIATAASYGITGKRVGTHYLYNEREISDYEAELCRLFGRPMPLYLRRRSDARSSAQARTTAE